MRAMNVTMEEGRFAFTRTISSLTQELPVYRSNSDYKWNINVKWCIHHSALNSDANLYVKGIRALTRASSWPGIPLSAALDLTVKM